jgi:hypothetical protein
MAKDWGGAEKRGGFWPDRRKGDMRARDWKCLLKGVLGMAFPLLLVRVLAIAHFLHRSIKAPLCLRSGKAAPFIPQQKTVEHCNLRSLVGSFGVLGLVRNEGGAERTSW